MPSANRRRIGRAHYARPLVYFIGTDTVASGARGRPPGIVRVRGPGQRWGVRGGDGVNRRRLVAALGTAVVMVGASACSGGGSGGAKSSATSFEGRKLVVW